MDDVTALRDALHDPLCQFPKPHGCHVYAALDRLIAAVEARAALTPERLVVAVVDALMAEEVGDGHYRWQFENIVRPAILAALPRPEEPRVERCAFVWKSGTPCGRPKRDSRHKHDSSCLTGGEGHITDMLCHPYTPEAR